MEWQRDFRHHAMGRKVEYPCVPGHELAGVVKQIGSGSAKRSAATKNRIVAGG